MGNTQRIVYSVILNYNAEMVDYDGESICVRLTTDNVYWLSVHSGTIHKENGPALIYPNGDRVWYKHGMYHNEYGPAVVFASGKKEYWLEDKIYDKKEWKKLVDRRKVC